MRDRRGQTPVWIALALLLGLTGAALLYLTRGTTFWFDEWEWVIQRRGGGLDTLLRPHNGHFSLVPVAIYKLLFATVGLAHSAPYRLVVVVAHLTCGLLLFVYARRRVGPVAALAITALLLLLGPAWQNFLWPFQIGWLIPLAAAIAALLALDRGDRRGDVVACALLAIALASSGLGIVVAIGLAVEVGWGRRRARDAWVVVVPLVLYAAWWLAYHHDQTPASNVFRIPAFAADAAGASLSALAGLNGVGVTDTGAAVGWGRPLALAAVAALAWCLRRRPPAPRTLTLLAMPLAFWLLIGLTRAQISTPAESRYLYVGGLLVLLLAVELASGAALPRAGAVLLAVAFVAALVANLGDLREGARYLRDQSLLARADLGAVELARGTAPPDAPIAGLPGYPLVVMTVGGYLRAEREDGSPAATPAQIATAPESARLLADAELARLGGVRLASASPASSAAPAPAVDAAAGEAVARRGACARVAPAGLTSGGAPRWAALTVPVQGVRLTARGGVARIAVRRFAAGFPAGTLATLGPSSSADLVVARDAVARPWHVRVRPDGRLIACTLRPGATG